jgi:uncharacterized SAM-binding protein YcdF (DUF218 family)
MTFILSKIVAGLLAPVTLLFLAITCGIFLRSRKPRWSLGLLISSSLFLGLLLICPLGNWSLAPLELRFPRPDLNGQQIDGIIVLGGMLDPDASRQLGMPVLNDAAERLTEFVALARRYPQARLVFSGGSGSLRSDEREANGVRSFLVAQGVDLARVTFEDRSRNTIENATESLKRVLPKASEHWLLVTSAFHMPRSVGCFRAVGWAVIPYPVDYRIYTDADFFEFKASQQLGNLRVALREYIGLASYRVMNRTPELFPAP